VAALARFGTVALIGWAVMAFGAICLGIVFARLARVAPRPNEGTKQVIRSRESRHLMTPVTMVPACS
jgi:hypothetical protein